MNRYVIIVGFAVKSELSTGRGSRLCGSSAGPVPPAMWLEFGAARSPVA